MDENDNIKNEQKDYISYNHLESQNTSYNSNKFQKIFLDLDENPDITIEKILINIFNNYIQENNQLEKMHIMRYQGRIKVLCSNQDKYKIVYYLLTKIRSLINKYKEKLFELPNIIELHDKIFRGYDFRSHSQKVNFSSNYINYRLDNLHITRNRNHSQKRKYFDYYIAIKNLFCELKNIKSCLERTAPIIEKVFEIPLSEFEKFSIYECEKEDFFNILIKDTFIWYEINKNRKTKLNCIIEELVKDINNKTNLMSEKINFFKEIYEKNKINLDVILKISNIGSSEETRFPEDAKPKIEMKYEMKETINNSNSNIDGKTIDLFPFDEEIDDYDYSVFDENSIGSINTLSNIDDIEIINEIKENINLYNKLKMNKPAIIENNSTNSNNNINIISDHIGLNNKSEFLDKKKHLQSEKEKFEKTFNFKNSVNINHDINIMIDKNIKENHYQKLKKNKIKLLKNKDRVLKDKTKNKNENGKDKESKKETNTKSSKESEKNNIPNDIDDLVKYITNDDKGTKKKKNRKKNKKNKNQKKNAKEETLNVEDKKEKEKEEEENEDEELNEVKKDILKNSINRFKIHKIKFKFGPNWLVKLSEYQ